MKRFRSLVKASIIASSLMYAIVASAQGVYEIGDWVWNDLNRNGIQDPGEPGLAGALVTLTYPDGTTRTLTTGVDGLYLFTNLYAGEFTVSVTSPAGFMPSSCEATYDYEIDSNVNPTTIAFDNPMSIRDIDFGFYSQGPTGKSIGDYVWNDANKNGIQDAGENGLAGAKVTLMAPDGTTLVVTTGADGSYLFENLAPGQYTVSVAPPTGYVASPANASGSTPDNDSNSSPASVNLQQVDIHNIDFGFSPEIKTYSIGDFVWNDTNRNGIQDPGEPGLAGAVLKLTKPDGTLLTLTTTASGSYKFANLLNGRYGLAVTLPAGGYVASPVYAIGSTPENDSNTNPLFVDVLNEDVANIDFGYNIPVMSLGDRVWNDANKNGIQDAGEQGLAGIVVKLGCPDGSTKTATTDANGTYLFSNLNAGQYTVTVTAPTGYTASPKNAAGSTVHNDSDGSPTTVTLTDANVLNVDFGYYVATFSIGDKVWKDTNANGIQDAGEPGLAGITVSLSGAATKTAVTDANGNYTFTGLVAGNYTVTVNAPAGFIASPKNAVGSTVDNDSNGNPATVTLNNANITNVDFGYYQPTYSIGDRVWKDTNANGLQDSGEPGLAGVAVKLNGPDGTIKTTTTNANGSYTFTGLVAGSYTLTVTTPTGYVASPKNVGTNDANDSDGSPVTVVLANANITNVDFGYYQPTYSLGDKVWNDIIPNGIQDSGEPGLQGVTVKLTFPNGATTTTTTNATGNYQFTGLSAGQYTVSIASLPVGTWIASPKNVGTNDTIDSDGSPVTVNLTANNNTIDFGYYPQSNPAGGHIDVDTSSKWYAPNKGKTDGHVHEYDDKYDISHVDWRALKDNKLRNIQNVVASGKQFRIVVANGRLNPGAMIVVNNTVTPAASFVETGQVYTTATLNTFKVFFNQNTMTGILGTETGAVRANQPGKYGEWRNGALTIQAIDASKFQIDPKTGVVINKGGLLWEGTIFWHHHCGTYGESNWQPNCPE